MWAVCRTILQNHKTVTSSNNIYNNVPLQTSFVNNAQRYSDQFYPDLSEIRAAVITTSIQNTSFSGKALQISLRLNSKLYLSQQHDFTVDESQGLQFVFDLFSMTFAVKMSQCDITNPAGFHALVLIYFLFFFTAAIKLHWALFMFLCFCSFFKPTDCHIFILNSSVEIQNTFRNVAAHVLKR